MSLLPVPIPLYHLELKTIDDNGLTPVISASGLQATCTDSVHVVPDDRFGTCLGFANDDAQVRIANVGCPSTLTIAGYLKSAPSSGTKIPFSFGRYSSTSVNGLYILQARQLTATRSSMRSGYVLSADTWYHVAFCVNMSSGDWSAFVDGNLCTQGSMDVHSSSSTPDFILGPYRSDRSGFIGRMSNVMVYDRILSEDEIQQIIADLNRTDEETDLDRPAIGVVNLDLANQDDEPVAYIRPDDTQTLSISIENTSGAPLRLKPPTDLQASPDNYHLQLRFRPGVLSDAMRAELAAGTSALLSRLTALGWGGHFEGGNAAIGDRLSLLWQGTTVAEPDAQWPHPRLLDGVLSPRARKSLPLEGFQVKQGPGTRTTRVLMAFSNLMFEDGSAVPDGHRVELLHLLHRVYEQARAAEVYDRVEDDLAQVNGSIDGVQSAIADVQNTSYRNTAGLQTALMAIASELDDIDNNLGDIQGSIQDANKVLGMADGGIPLLVEFIGSNTVFNDGGACELKIRIQNRKTVSGNSQPLQLFSSNYDGHSDTQPKFILEFEPGVIESDDLAAISVVDNTSQWYTEDSTGKWRSLRHTSYRSLTANEEVIFTIRNIKTTGQARQSYFTVRYEDVHEFGEGEFRLPITIGPLKVERPGGQQKDVVVIRRGDHTNSVDASDEALFVEVASGKAARFYGGPVEFDEVTSSSGVHFTTDGTGKTARFTGGSGVEIEDGLIVSGDTVLNNALQVSQQAEFKRGMVVGPYGITVNADTNAYGLKVDQNGTGQSAWFVGGLGVKIENGLIVAGYSTLSSGLKVQRNSSNEGLLIDQDGTGPSAKFTGGSGVEIQDGLEVHSGSLPVFSTTSSHHFKVHRFTYLRSTSISDGHGGSILEVTQTGGPTGSQYSAKFMGGKGIRVEGRVEHRGLYNFSDARHKKNIQPLTGVLNRAVQLRGVTFLWKDDDRECLQYGFIAQEVEEVFPDLVDTDGEGFKSLDTQGFTPILLEAMRELREQHQAEISVLNQRIDQLETMLTQLLSRDGKETS